MVLANSGAFKEVGVGIAIARDPLDGFADFLDSIRSA